MAAVVGHQVANCAPPACHYESGAGPISHHEILLSDTEDCEVEEEMTDARKDLVKRMDTRWKHRCTASLLHALNQARLMTFSW
eukprot:3064572-Pyramimonas_sp.AAC.2